MPDCERLKTISAPTNIDVSVVMRYNNIAQVVEYEYGNMNFVFPYSYSYSVAPLQDWSSATIVRAAYGNPGNHTRERLKGKPRGLLKGCSANSGGRKRRIRHPLVVSNERVPIAFICTPKIRVGRELKCSSEGISFSVYPSNPLGGLSSIPRCYVLSRAACSPRAPLIRPIRYL